MAVNLIIITHNITVKLKKEREGELKRQIMVVLEKHEWLSTRKIAKEIRIDKESALRLLLRLSSEGKVNWDVYKQSPKGKIEGIYRRWYHWSKVQNQKFED